MTANRTFRLTALLIASTILPSSGAVLAQDTPSLPAGVSSIQETYQDWRVFCQVLEATKHCALSHQQVQQDGQRVLAIELQAGADDAITGNLVLPFGLLLNAGVTLQVDDQPAMSPLSFRTCLPVGCVAPLDLDQSSVAALRAGTTLSLMVQANDTEQDFAFAISLNGFTAGLDRVEALMAS